MLIMSVDSVCLGTFSSQGGTCQNCSAGEFSSSGSGSCSQCAMNRYSASGASKCTYCPGNSYAEPGDASCTPCLSFCIIIDILSTRTKCFICLLCLVTQSIKYSGFLDFCKYGCGDHGRCTSDNVCSCHDFYNGFLCQIAPGLSALLPRSLGVNFVCPS